MTYVSGREVGIERLGAGRLRFSMVLYGTAYFREVGPYDDVTLLEAAALLKVDRATMFKWVRDGKLDDVNSGGVAMVALPQLYERATTAGYPWPWWD